MLLPSCLPAHPEVLITLVILTGSLCQIDPPVPEYQVLDFFAGAARIARGARVMDLPAAAFDIGYHPNDRVFNINSDAGMASLSSIYVFITNVCGNISWKQEGDDFIYA